MKRTYRISFSALVSQLREDRSRWFLWYPVLVGLGIALFFSLKWQPGSVWLAVPVPFLAGLIALWRRDGSGAKILLTAGLLVSIGFSASIVRTIVVAAPVLQAKEVTTVTAKVLEKSTGYKRARVLLGNLEFSDGGAVPPLEYIRLTSRSNMDAVKPGQQIRVKAVLLPPPAPAYPGGYDFQRHSYYQSIGAVGYSIGKFKILGENAGIQDWFLRRSAEVRNNIAEFVLHHMPPENAGFIVAIMTGDKDAIPQNQLDDMRQSGLAHLLAISGLHMGMIGGLIFFASRFLLVLSPYVALYYPVKKIAAVIALFGLAGYLFVSGMSVSAVRAYIMISAVFTAICFDRTALSFRMVALAALVILLLFPESLITPSFQMSFAAVFALIALYETIGPRLSAFARSGGLLRRIAAYILGIILTSLVAGLATAPFALYHFGQIAAYSLIANLLAVPIMGLWVMPWVIVSFLAYPFGVVAPLVMTGAGIDLILAIARETASWPGAAQYLGTFGTLQLVAITLTCLWLIIWRRGARWLALPAAFLTFLTFFQDRTPDILMAESGNLYALHTEHGELYLSSRRAEKFEAERWQLILGQHLVGRKHLPLACDPYGCVYRDKGMIIAFPETVGAIEMDCLRADIIVSRFPVRGICPHPRLVVDRFDLWRRGAHSLYLGGSGGIMVESVNELRGDRPWVPHRYRESPYREGEG